MELKIVNYSPFYINEAKAIADYQDPYNIIKSYSAIT